MDAAMDIAANAAHQKSWQRNLVLLNSIAFTRMFMLVLPIFVPLMAHYGLNMHQTMLLQSVFAGTVLLCELPSGYLSDIWGRRQVLIIANLFGGLGFSVLLFADSFASVALFEVLIGVAFSLSSGTDTSMVYESEQALKRPDSGKAIAHQLSWMGFGEAVAAGLTTLLMLKGYRWVLLVQMVVGWLPLLLSLALREPPRTRSSLSHRENGKAIWKAFTAQRSIPILAALFLLVMSFIWLVAWLNQPLWLGVNLDPFWFGLLWGGECLVVGLVARYAQGTHRYLLASRRWWLLAIAVLASWAFIAHSATLAGLLVGAYLAATLHGAAIPWIREGINRLVDSTYRATINSVLSTLFRGFNLLLGPWLGSLVDTHGASGAGAWLLLIAAPLAVLLCWWGWQQRESSRDL
ncbi:MFS transporter [bacterium SCSIO 12696]|nr:MFS transporter [bacterium SCSIO 12696]